MAPQGLRVVAAASLLPAIPLLLAHGIVSHSPVPATGLVPLFFSSGFSFFVVRYRRSSRNDTNNTNNTGSSVEDHEQQPLLPNKAPQAVEQRDDDADADDNINTPFDQRYPFVIFLCDVVLAAAILTDLVFTWLSSSLFNGQLAMLAAYGTIPLLINFFIHILFAVRALSSGLAIPELTTWVAWQIVPGDCPGCGHHLRPESSPNVPWIISAQRTGAAAAEGIRGLKAPTMPKVPVWLRPAAHEDGAGDVHDAEEDAEGQTSRPTAPAKPQWLRRHAWLGYGAVAQGEEARPTNGEEGETARLFVDPEPSRSRDDDEDDVLNRDAARSHTPPEIVVVGKKKQRKPQTSHSPTSGPDDVPW